MRLHPSTPQEAGDHGRSGGGQNVNAVALSFVPSSVASSPAANSVASSPGPFDDYFEEGDGFVEEEDVYMNGYDDHWSECTC